MKQNRKPLISVIVPVYNAKKYIGMCLDSLRSQTYPNIEIICVDDHSTDSSGLLCDRYAEIDPRIHVIHKAENGGLSEARNTGIQNAKGEYLSFVDADDWVDRQFLECLYDSLVQHGADIAQCGYVHIKNEAFAVHKPLGSKNVRVMTGKQALRELYSVTGEYASIEYTVVWDKLYKRRILSGLYFPKGRIYEDQFFTYRCFDRAKKIVVNAEKLYYYRQSSGSITRRSYDIRFQDDIAAHSEQIRYFGSKDRDFSEIVIARIMPLCILHYRNSEFEDDACAKKNAYRYAFKYVVPYLKNRKVSLKNKGKVLAFLLWPDMFIFYEWDIRFNVQ